MAKSELLALESRPLMSWTTLGRSGHLIYELGREHCPLHRFLEYLMSKPKRKHCLV